MSEMKVWNNKKKKIKIMLQTMEDKLNPWGNGN